jgi:hypothetical protein
VPTKSEIYRERSQECERVAATVSDRTTKVRLLELALDWRQMANNAEKSPELKEDPAWRTRAREHA